ncbi:hypothetical protein CLU79DRAFT_838593 [Phycomyces nitens]|nr:hypothetical protein CLU79DRAFT_838593 [Phycomyces nitens]
MVPELPFEILSLVASFLSQKDRITCLEICKDWLPAFQHSLWQMMFIDDTFINSIYDTRPSSDNVYRINGFRVQRLKMTINSPVQKHLFGLLQQLFPCIRHLEFLVDVQPDLYTVDLFDWNLWTSLTQLEITLDDSIRELGPKATFEQLSSLNSLVRFNMISYNSTEIDYCFKLEDFEALYYHLPNLVCVESDYDIGTLFLDDLKNTRIIPAVAVEKIICRQNYAQFNIHWVIYYGLKYPKLETLSLNINTGRQRIPLTSQDYLKSVLSTFPNIFCSLKTLETTGCADFAEDMAALYYALERSKAPIENLSICVLNVFRGSQLIQKIMNFINLFTATLKKLKFSLVIDCYPPQAIPDHNCHCPGLTYLEIKLFHCSVQIDYILDQYPSLQTSKIQGSKISIGQTPAPSLHGLQVLDINCGELGVDVMSYISSRCRNLKRLRLNVLSFNPLQIKDNFYLFDMPYTQLDELNISMMKMKIQPCQLFVIKQEVEITQQNIDPACALGQDLETQGFLTKCYVLQDKIDSIMPERFKVLELSHQNIKYIQIYYPEFGRENSLFEGIGNSKERLCVSDNYWRPFTYGGYLTFKCKSVKNYYFQPYESRL